MSFHPKDKCPICGRLKDVRSKRCKNHKLREDEVRQYRREWRAKNSDKILAYSRKYRKLHREECRLRTLKNRRENPEQYRRRQKKFMESRWKWLHEYKHERGCKFCPENDPRCLDFHHKDPKSKVKGISTPWMLGGKRERLMKEIKKCILICSNCHRKLTHRRYDK